VTCRNIKSGNLKWLSSLLFVLLATFFSLSPCRAQQETPSAPSLSQPLFWADGITQVTDLDAYTQTGLNTVVVRLTWRPTPGGRITQEDLQFPRAFANAAAAKGLKVVYSLPPAPLGQERAFRIAGDSEPYLLLWSSWVKGAIDALKDTPNLLGWMLPDDPRALPFAAEVGFTKWISSNYADVGVLNAQWNTSFESLADVTLANSQQVVRAWQQRKAAPLQAVQPLEVGAEEAGGTAQPKKKDTSRQSATARQQAMLREKQEQLAALQAPDLHWPFHPVQLAVAHYKWDAYRLLLRRWAQTVKEHDPSHILMSGRLPDYAQLLSLPHEVDVSVPDLQPDWAEADVVTHNPQAVDIARRGGRFRAVPVFATSSSLALSKELLPRLVAPWCETALLHGASGFGFASWHDLTANEPLRLAIQTTLGRLQRPPFRALWSTRSIVTAAVVLTPLADGHTLAEGPPSWSQGPRGLYGFGEGMVSGEPSNLAYTLRWGTMFGGVDYLAPDDIVEETDDQELPTTFGAPGAAAPRSALTRYNTVLLPQALSVSPEVTSALTGYVAQGGVVVADLGLGAAQSNGQILALPAGLAGLFGLPPATALSTTAFDLQPQAASPLFPMWSRNADGSNIMLSAGSSSDEAAFQGPVAYFALPLAPGTVVIASAPPTSIKAAITLAGASTRQLHSLLTLHPVGTGAAVFAPWQLWNTWRADHFGFSTFHSDLLMRGAGVALLTSPAFVPAPGPAMGGGAPLSPEIVNYPNAIALVNHQPAQLGPVQPGLVQPEITTRTSAQMPPTNTLNSTPAPSNVEGTPPTLQHTAVRTANAGDFLWSEAITVFVPPNNEESAGAALPLATGRPVPVAVQSESGSAYPMGTTSEYSASTPYVTLHTTVKAGQTKVLRLLPIRVQYPANGIVTTSTERYEPQRIRLVVWPNSARVMPREESYKVTVAPPGAVRLTVYDAPDNVENYRVVPGSRHRVTVADLSAAPVAPTVSTKKSTSRNGTTASPRAQVETAPLHHHNNRRLLCASSPRTRRVASLLKPKAQRW
jgi:hypothetical protein